MKYIIFGAGLSGCSIARLLKDAGKEVVIYEKSNKIGGACRDEIIDGKLVHIYGPHSFHTSNDEAWAFANKYDEFISFDPHTLVENKDLTYEFPINETATKTICEYLKIDPTPIIEKLHTMPEIITLSEYKQVNEQLGKWVWDNNFANYTSKMWNIPIDKIDMNVVNRIKLLTTPKHAYFPFDKYTAYPKNGYSFWLENMVSGIEIAFNTDIKKDDVLDASFDDIVIYTASVDELFNYEFGKLNYRSLTFTQKREAWNYEDCTVVNKPDDPIYTRKSNFNPLYNEKTEQEIVVYEQPCDYDGNNMRLYPISSDPKNQEIYNAYLEKLKQYPNIVLAGRAGSYKYFDMDKIIIQSLEIVKKLLSNDNKAE